MFYWSEKKEEKVEQDKEKEEEVFSWKKNLNFF